MELYSWYLKITDCLKIPTCKINFFLRHSILKIGYTVSPTFSHGRGVIVQYGCMDEGHFFLGGGGREGGVRLVKLTIRGGSFTPHFLRGYW